MTAAVMVSLDIRITHKFLLEQ